MACTCGYSSVLLQSNNASMINRSSLPSTLRAHQLKLDVRIVGSQLFGRDSTLLNLGARRYSAGISRRVNLTTCSAAGTGEGESTQSPLQTSTVPDESARLQVKDGLYKSVLPYLKLARLEKWGLSEPRSLIMWPLYWGATLAAENGTLPDLRTFALLAVATPILLAAHCAVNDLWDKDIDGKVERSKQRPLVTGEVTPFQGWIFFGAILLLYVAVISQLKYFSDSTQFQVQVAIQLILTVIYPLSKRWTNWTPAVWALTMNWGVFLGWSAVRGSVDLGPAALLPALTFFGAWCWTFVFETIYAYQDVKDDGDAGIKSLAVVLGDNGKVWLSGFGIAFVASLFGVGQITALGWPFYAGVAIAAAHVFWQITTVDLKNPYDCWAKFASNVWVGAFVFGGIACAKLLT